MKLTIDRAAVGVLLEHAASAAQLVGHMDDADEALAYHIDAIVHELSELLGDPGAISAVAANRRAVNTLASGAPETGGAR